jgi:hypothetical protein
MGVVHEGCVELRWGLDLEGTPGSWCSYCFEEWEEAWSNNMRGTSRGDITIAHDPEDCPDGPAPGTPAPRMWERAAKTKHAPTREPQQDGGRPRAVPGA